ncbi:MAG: YfiR family protein [Dechloromonas sp.]|nr:YfiR family protein [Dechloromonas sp.]
MRRFLSVLLFCLCQGGQADPVSEHDLKAGYLYNFVLHTEWPVWSRANFNVCILDDEDLGEAMARLDSKRVHGMRIVVARLSSLLPIQQCQLLYLPARRQSSLPRIAAELANSTVLTVSEVPNDHDSAIVLGLNDNRLVYDLNLSAFQRAGLKPRDVLLGLAQKVRK